MKLVGLFFFAHPKKLDAGNEYILVSVMLVVVYTKDGASTFCWNFLPYATFSRGVRHCGTRRDQPSSCFVQDYWGKEGGYDLIHP